MWKATAAYNLFPTESSGVAPFFLMFGHEAAVKHTLLESERPKYLGTDDSMINLELMSNLYMIVAHNLNEARKARDGNRKGRTTKEPEKLKIIDNVDLLVRNHTSKAFQPKYKDFCIVGLLGKNQIEIKDNHGHTTKVHHSYVKKIPMTEKVCQLYEEEQIGKVREGRKAAPSSKMPDLGWDITETQHAVCKQVEVQENSEINNPHTALPLQAIIAIAVIISTILEHVITYIQGILEAARKATQVVKPTTTKISCNKLFQNIKKSYKTAVLVITIGTNTMDRTSCTNQHQTSNSKVQKTPDMRKLNKKYDRLHQLRISRTHSDIVTTSTTSCKTVSDGNSQT